MITLERVTYHYPGDASSSPLPSSPALSNLSLEIEEGELILVVGPSGAGKSTFLRCLNGLVPHFYGGRLSGRIEVAGYDPVACSPQQMSRIVGMVFQDPETQFVTDQVEDELAFGMENQALPPLLMRKRVEEVLDQLSIAHLRDRYLSTLSGGEKQRVAIAAVLTVHPLVLVLDEPTSQLDPQSAEEVLVAIRRLNEDLGLTVILAEHRLERVVQFVDQVLYLPGGDAEPLFDTPRAVMAQVSLAPPLAELGKARAWRPLPLTVKEARRFVRRERQVPVGSQHDMTAGRVSEKHRQKKSPTSGSNRFLSRSLAAELATLVGRPAPGEPSPSAAAVVQAENLSYRYENGQQALRRVDLALRPGEVVALMGRNGSGKSTLLKHLVGLIKPASGRVTIRQQALGRESPPLDTRSAATRDIVRIIGYVPQDPAALLFRDTVLEELAFTRQGHGLPANEAADRALLARLGLSAQAERYPRDLSTGQRQRVALASILVADPLVLLLDEPTRGLDYGQKEALTQILLALKAEGRAILMATHDVELAARCADRVVLMGDGEIVVDGPIREVMTGSLVFASQINKLYRDPRFLVVEDVLGVGPEHGAWQSAIPDKSRPRSTT